MYALDVAVERTATSPTSGPIKFEYAFDFFGSDGWGSSESLLWNSPTGRQPDFVELLGLRPRDGNPLSVPYSNEVADFWTVHTGSSLTEAIRLNLGELEVGESVTFTLYFSLSRRDAPVYDEGPVDDYAIYVNAWSAASPVWAFFAASDLTYHS